LVYSDAKNCISDVIYNGKILMRDGKIGKESEIIKKGKQLLKNFLKKCKVKL
jgi:hypothetical protein